MRHGRSLLGPEPPLRELHDVAWASLLQTVDAKAQELKLGELGVDTGYKAEKGCARREK